MQFMPGTWASMGVDGDGDGSADIHKDADSIHSAVNYLTKSGVSTGAAGVRRALFAYNNVDWYVNDVPYYASRSRIKVSSSGSRNSGELSPGRSTASRICWW